MTPRARPARPYRITYRARLARLPGRPPLTGRLLGWCGRLHAEYIELATSDVVIASMADIDWRRAIEARLAGRMSDRAVLRRLARDLRWTRRMLDMTPPRLRVKPSWAVGRDRRWGTS